MRWPTLVWYDPKTNELFLGVIKGVKNKPWKITAQLARLILIGVL